MSVIFLSYRRNDTPYVTGSIYDRLVRSIGEQSVFKDVDKLAGGQDFLAELDRTIRQCEVMLVVLGPQWLAIGPSGRSRLFDAHDVVRQELELALRLNKTIIPLLTQGASMPAVSDLPASLSAFATKNALLVRPDPDFHHDMDKVVQACIAHHVVPDTSLPPAPPVPVKVVAKKSPLAAAVLEAMFPGLGLFYAGQVVGGLVALVGSVAGVLFANGHYNDLVQEAMIQQANWNADPVHTQPECFANGRCSSAYLPFPDLSTAQQFAHLMIAILIVSVIARIALAYAASGRANRRSGADATGHGPIIIRR